MLNRLLVIILLGSLPATTLSQGGAEDYNRAARMREVTRHKVWYEPMQVQWVDDGRAFIYKIQTAGGEQYFMMDINGRQKKLLFDTRKFMIAFDKASGTVTDKRELPLADLAYDAAKNVITFKAHNHSWEYDITGDNIIDKGELPAPGESLYWGTIRDEDFSKKIPSPDGKWNAYIKNSNVYIKARDNKEEIQMSFDGSPGEFYSGHIVWSPNSAHLAVSKVRPAPKRILYLVESSPEDQLQPKLHTRDYLKPGDALTQRTPVLFSIEGKKQVAVPAELIANQYSIGMFRWTKDSRAFTFEYNQRGHQQYAVYSVDAATGKVKTLISETSKTFIDYSGKKYRYDVNDSREIIWASERDGWNHLYLYDESGNVKQITRGNWVVRRVVHVDEKNRTILFEASGKNEGQDPYFIHYYRIRFDGTQLVALTAENGNHSAVFSPDYKRMVNSYSRIDQPPVTVLRDATTGKIITGVEKADIAPLLATGWQLPEVFHTKGRDGATDIWGMIIRPSNFDPGKKYPVIEYIYAGPHSSFVPKSFVTDSRGDLHQLAELGFIVVQIDGMGTSNRSKAFHDVCWRNLHDSGFPDRIQWIKDAAAKYPAMDISQVGIFGNSAGGQSSAGALLHHPDFYKVAVSSSGCHDNRMDKIWWNEQWMGYPIGEQYAQSSNVTHAHKLEGKLMLILGELDDNVDPSSTFQLVNAIIKANKVCDLLFVPGMGHSLGGDYGEHRRRDFFVKHLLGVDPPEWKDLQ